MMNILVTGGSGLLGKCLQDHIPEGNNDCWIFLSKTDCDLTDRAEVIKVFKKFQPTKVIHLAACVGGVYKNMESNCDMLLDNLKMNTNVLEQCHSLQVQKTISMLSTCIFPDDTTYPINESMLHKGEPHKSNYGYSYAKRMLQTLSFAYTDQYKQLMTCLIPTNLFGPYDNFNLDAGHVIPVLIHKTYLAKKHNAPLVVFGSGKPLRQFLYAPDCAKLIVWALNSYNDPIPLILSVHEKEEISIKEVVRIICDAFCFAGEVKVLIANT